MIIGWRPPRLGGETKKERARRLLLLPILTAILGACGHTRVTADLWERSTENVLDGVYTLSSLEHDCEGWKEKSNIHFHPLERLADGVVVNVKSSRNIKREINLVCFTFYYPSKEPHNHCIDMRQPENSWAEGGIWWSPKVRQTFPYILGIDRKWLVGKVLPTKEGIALVQERTVLQAGLLKVPHYSVEQVRCDLRTTTNS